MKTAKTIALAFAITAAAVFTNTSEAEAQAPGYQVSVWRNCTPLSIGGQYRWGNGPWQNFRFAPGHQGAVWAPNTAPTIPLYIRFDADPGPGVLNRSFRLRTYYSPTTVFRNGHTEAFVLDSNGWINIRNTR